VRDECYSAVQSQGAFLNGQRLAPSSVRDLDHALVAASLPAHLARNSVEVKRLVELLYECQALRRLGSAALNLCYTAAGRLDGYWASSISMWDVAAATLLIREAGGVVTTIDGGPFQLEQHALIAAGNSVLHAELGAVLAAAP
jgi:myo-inositol-1(or 4)-monophosphatase